LSEVKNTKDTGAQKAKWTFNWFLSALRNILSKADAGLEKAESKTQTVDEKVKEVKKEGAKK
jgi:hypothetical protein